MPNGDQNDIGYEEEEYGRGFAGFRPQDLVLTPAQYGRGNHPTVTLEGQLKRLTETRFSEVGIDINRQRGGNRCYVEVWTERPVERVEVQIEWKEDKDGNFVSGPKKKTQPVFTPVHDIFPTENGEVVFERDRYLGARAEQRLVPVTEYSRVFVFTPELNKTIPRQYLGPRGRYPKWMLRENLSMHSRSYHRMKRAVAAGVDRLTARRQLTREDKKRKDTTGKEFAPYSVFYPMVGAIGALPPPGRSDAPRDQWVPKDFVYRRAIRLGLRSPEPDPRELVELTRQQRRALARQARAEFVRAGSNVRFGVQEEWPEGLYYNAVEDHYEIDICDLDIKGRTMLAHRHCAEQNQTYKQCWRNFEETVRRKGFRRIDPIPDPVTDERVVRFGLITEEELKPDPDNPTAHQKRYESYLEALDDFLEEHHDRDYPSDQIREPRILSRVFGAQTSDPDSQADALRDLVKLSVYVQSPPTVNWEYRPRHFDGKEVYGHWEPVVDYSNFRYEAENIEWFRKRLHRIQHWQMSRSINNRREAWNLETRDIDVYVRNNFGGQWEQIAYRKDWRFMILQRIARRYAPLPSSEDIPDALDFEEEKAKFLAIKNPTHQQRREFEQLEEGFEAQLEAFRYWVGLRHSILDWAWFFREPWMVMPHDGSLATIFAEAWATQLDQMRRERGLNSAAGDGAMPDWDTLIKEWTSRVRNYADESDWSSTIEYAVRDPIAAWLNHNSILGQMNPLTILNVRISAPGTYQLESFIRVNYDNATQARDFMKAMWAHQPVEPKRIMIERALEEAKADHIGSLTPIITKLTSGLPSIVIPRVRGLDLNLKEGRRIDIERMIWNFRRQSVLWNEARILELTYMGRAHAFSGAMLERMASNGDPWRIGDDLLSEAKYYRNGLWVWANQKLLDTLLGRAKAQETGHWSADEDRKWVRENLLRNNGDPLSLMGIDPQVSGVQKGEAYRVMDEQRLSYGLRSWTGFSNDACIELAEMMVAKATWEQIRARAEEICQEIGDREEVKEARVRYLQMIFMTSRGQTLSAIVAA